MGRGHVPPQKGGVTYNDDVPPSMAGQIAEVGLAAMKAKANELGDGAAIGQVTILLQMFDPPPGEDDGMTAGYYHEKEQSPETVLNHVLNNAKSMATALGIDLTYNLDRRGSW